MADQPADLSHVGQYLKTHDSDRFTLCLLAPEDRREALFALFAFNIEVAKTREVVSEPMLGQMRLQWWRDVVETIYAGGEPPRHDIAPALGGAVREYGVARIYLERLIDGRERDLTDDRPGSLAALESYARETAEPLFQAGLDILGISEDDTAREAMNDIATSYAIIGLIRAIPFHARMRALWMPKDLLEDANLSDRAVFEYRGGACGIEPVVKVVADRARELVGQARGEKQRFADPQARPLLRAATLAEQHLRMLHRAGYNPFDQRVQSPPPLRAAALLWRRVVGSY